MKFLMTALASITLTTMACVNARDEYNDYASRIADAAPPADAMIVSSVPDITGEFFMAARVNLPEDLFLYFDGSFVFTAVTENTGKVDAQLIALDFRTFEQVGAPFVAPDVAVGTDGIAHIPLIGQLHGRANPVSESNVQLDAIIHAQLRSAEFFCGDLTGTGGALRLDGTTFGAQRVTITNRPDPIHRCEDQPAP